MTSLTNERMKQELELATYGEISGRKMRRIWSRSVPRDSETIVIDMEHDTLAIATLHKNMKEIDDPAPVVLHAASRGSGSGKQQIGGVLRLLLDVVFEPTASDLVASPPYQYAADFRNLRMCLESSKDDDMPPVVPLLPVSEYGFTHPDLVRGHAHVQHFVDVVTPDWSTTLFHTERMLSSETPLHVAETTVTYPMVVSANCGDALPGLLLHALLTLEKQQKPVSRRKPFEVARVAGAATTDLHAASEGQPLGNAVILLDGTAFQLDAGPSRIPSPMELSAVVNAAIQCPVAFPIPVLTQLPRSEWRAVAHQLSESGVKTNRRSLAAIDAAAWVVCIDRDIRDPRHNRWMGSGLQFVVGRDNKSLTAIHEETCVSARVVRELLFDIEAIMASAFVDYSARCEAWSQIQSFPQVWQCIDVKTLLEALGRSATAKDSVAAMLTSMSPYVCYDTSRDLLFNPKFETRHLMHIGWLETPALLIAEQTVTLTELTLNFNKEAALARSVRAGLYRAERVLESFPNVSTAHATISMACGAISRAHFLLACQVLMVRLGCAAPRRHLDMTWYDGERYGPEARYDWAEITSSATLHAAEVLLGHTLRVYTDNEKHAIVAVAAAEVAGKSQATSQGRGCHCLLRVMRSLYDSDAYKKMFPTVSLVTYELRGVREGGIGSLEEVRVGYSLSAGDVVVAVTSRSLERSGLVVTLLEASLRMVAASWPPSPEERRVSLVGRVVARAVRKSVPK